MPGMAPEFMMILQPFQQKGAANAQAAEQRFRQQRADDMKRHEDNLKSQQQIWHNIQESSQIFCRNLHDIMGSHPHIVEAPIPKPIEEAPTPATPQEAPTPTTGEEAPMPTTKPEAPMPTASVEATTATRQPAH
jgi:hypothetical protein